MKIETRLADILLYAIGMVNSSAHEVKTIDFFKRISKYLRSIGYYGDSPYMMCNYGSSEYAQAFSRIGSLFGNVYIVNEDLEINSVSRVEQKITAIDINYNDAAVEVKDGVIASTFMNRFIDEEVENVKVSSCHRVTLIMNKPILEGVESLATFVIPPNCQSI